MTTRRLVLVTAFVAFLARASWAQGPMAVEKVHDGFAVAPDVEVTRVDRSTATLVGA